MKHTRLPYSEISSPRQMEAHLRQHRNCIAGDGDTAACCSARKQLLAARHGYLWTFPVPPPTRSAIPR